MHLPCIGTNWTRMCGMVCLWRVFTSIIWVCALFWCKNREVNPGSLGKPRQRASQEDERWGVVWLCKNSWKKNEVPSNRPWIRWTNEQHRCHFVFTLVHSITCPCARRFHRISQSSEGNLIGAHTTAERRECVLCSVTFPLVLIRFFPKIRFGQLFIENRFCGD